MTGITIEMDPKVRIQGLLETTNRYLERARAAEADTRNVTGGIVALKEVVTKIKNLSGAADSENEVAGAIHFICCEVLDLMPEVPSQAVWLAAFPLPASEEESVGC